MQPKFKIGQTVRKIINLNQVGTIIEIPRLVGGSYWYKVRFYNQLTATVLEDALEEYSNLPEPETEFINFSFSDHRSFARIITFKKLVGGYLNNPAAFKASKTLFKPHQYKPLLKFLYSENQRLLIADEVGLGKTIEAGFILLELESRKKIKSSFIICPKSLGVKWEREMREKFGIEYEMKNKDQVLRFLDDKEKGILTGRFLGIVSYQTMRNRLIRDRLAEVSPEIDLVIFDEMHWARNETSQTNRLARQISQLSDAVLGLTATPIMLGNQNLFNLLYILNPYEFQSDNEFQERVSENIHITAALRSLSKSNYVEALSHLDEFRKGNFGKNISESPLFISVVERLNNNETSREKTVKLLKDVTELSLLAHVVTRTKRKEVELKSRRKAQTFKLTFNDFERKFYDAVTNFILEKYSKIDPGRRGSSFALMMPQRQVASCIPAMIEHYLNNPEFLAKYDEELSEFEDLDNSINGATESESSSLQVRELIMKLVSGSEKFIDSKFKEFFKVIEHLLSTEPDVKILVFSYFKATLRYLNKCLDEKNVPNYLISGDIDPISRQDIIDNFRAGIDKRVLLSSEVGSEGLDLEFCSVVINYDLPWNPMVVEQRIGRADRFGQQSDVVTIVNFSVDDTIESRILDRLYERIKIFEEAIGDLESILGEEVQKLTLELLSQKLTAKEQEDRIEEVARIILNKKLHAQELEEQSTGLLTNDEYFRQELESIIQEKRYLTPEELLIYINEFLRTKYPDCLLQPTIENTVYEMNVSKDLEYSLRESIRKQNIESPAITEFYRKISQFNRRLSVTLDPEYALKDHSLSLINAFHPLVLFITQYLSDNQAEVYPTSAIALDNIDHLKPGIYFYSTFEQSISGGRNYKTLSHVIINESLVESVTASQAAEIVGEMVLRGSKFDFEYLRGKYDMQKLFDVMDEINLKRFDDAIREIKRLNESSIQKQIDLTNRVYNSRIERIRETITEIGDEPKRKKIIPALLGRIKSFEIEIEQKLREINARQHIEQSTSILSAGILKIDRNR